MSHKRRLTRIKMESSLTILKSDVSLIKTLLRAQECILHSTLSNDIFMRDVRRNAPSQERRIPMNTKVFTLFLILTVSAASCKKNSQSTEPIAGNLSGSSWQLTQIDTVNGGSLFLEQADTIILKFDDQRRISGKSPGRCGNTYFGVYSIPTDNAIRTDSLITTEIYCANSQYHYYYYLLIRVETFQRYDARLDIICDNQSRRLVFRPVQ